MTSRLDLPELPPAPRASRLPWRRQALGMALLVAGLPALTAALVAHRETESFATPVLLTLSLVVAVALVGGAWVGVPGALLGALVLNWFFTRPYGTLVIDRPDQILVLVVYTGVAVAVSTVVGIAARQTREATRARAEAQTVAALARTALAAQDTLPALLDRVRQLFARHSAALVETGPDGDHVVAASGTAEDEPGDEVQRIPAGDGLTLQVTGPPLFAADVRLLASFAAAAATALEGWRLAERAQEAAVLEAADRTRTALLAAVGHDLRTPLAGIIAAASTLQQSADLLGDTDRAELVDTIAQAAERLEALVSNLLDASRLQAGAVVADPVAVGLDEVVARTMLTLPPDVRGRVHIDVPEALPDAWADPGLLERVLANLVDNAVRHSPAGLLVTVRAAAVAGRPVLDVEDHGPGVAPADRERVFTPFQRLGDRRHDGVGLGLAVARGLTEATGGTLAARTTPGGGLTMRVLLPASSAS